MTVGLEVRQHTRTAVGGSFADTTAAGAAFLLFAAAVPRTCAADLPVDAIDRETAAAASCTVVEEILRKQAAYMPEEFEQLPKSLIPLDVCDRARR